MRTEETLKCEYEEITDAGIVLREQRVGYSTHGYDFDDATGAIIGCALEVHRTLGPGFREVVYQRALALELQGAGLEFEQSGRNQVFRSEVPLGASKMPAIVRILDAEGSKTWFLTASPGLSKVQL